jgi:2-polyprenyl-3-methyl-5-hydroxy-6-metoxy-1,4-benzoquinol methylase
MRGVVWPRITYLTWGPKAPPVLQGLVAGLADWRGERITLDSAEAAQLLAPRATTQRANYTVQELEALMDSAHSQGIAGLDRAFDGVARVEDGSLRFTSLADARRYPSRGVLFRATRDRDRVAFNARFGASVLTEATARRLLTVRKAAVQRGYRDYSPIDFGGGLTTGRIASTDSGTGRWDFLNARVVAPLITGKRVLDLGCNNGSLPLMMARAGAARVVAIEYDPAIAEFARLNARILAWRDIRSYDIEIRTGDMRMFLSEDARAFDVVTAFCSLYYLPEPDMARIVRRAASSGAVLILQANDAIDNLPAKRDDLHRLMLENGYSDVRVHEYPGFARPLLVGMPAR